MFRKNSADLTDNYNFNENVIITNPKIKQEGKKKRKSNINKVNDDDFFIPEIKQYEILNILQYNVKQLKDICKHYKQKQTGNKNEIKKRMYNYLKETYYVTKIQGLFRRKIYSLYKFVKGNACFNRSICVNETDFITLGKLSEIPYHSFFSYENGNETYGFHIASIYNYIKKTQKQNRNNVVIYNPYNRSIISSSIIRKINNFIKYSRALKYPIILENEKDDIIFNEEEIIRNKTLELFQYMDSLGNYTNPNWFFNLDIRSLMRYLRELHDIWEYRAQLTDEVKKSIHYPNGTPFQNIHTLARIQNNNINILRKTILRIIENFVTKGINDESKSLGCFYVLGAFTLVNHEAASALPWLYESVHYIQI